MDYNLDNSIVNLRTTSGPHSRDNASVTTGILQIRWTDDGDKDVAALATMYIAKVPNPNGPITECSRSVATVTYAYRVMGIMREQMIESKKIVGTHSRTVTARARKCLISV